MQLEMNRCLIPAGQAPVAEQSDMDRHDKAAETTEQDPALVGVSLYAEKTEFDGHERSRFEPVSEESELKNFARIIYEALPPENLNNSAWLSIKTGCREYMI